ncbi:hypothetical protein OG840_01290 [Streptomyces sp. NBC_01764]|uniref:hypothetical protein n=1 Tax=Streptomyces sp. NBC_01764 TaxID=2975935 RepID=UPI0022584120|nr:hypothetical protein [Streptomyces sp. NBC_01764]MCX4400469.1 hypothetical protein [Streptomyces sp. NBC_01764]
MKVYPYKRLPGTVALRVDAVTMHAQGEPSEQLDARARSVVERTVALGQAETVGWDDVKLTVSVTVPSKATEAGGPWTDVAVLGVLTERATNTRVTALLQPSEEGGREWRGDLSVLRADLYDRATLTAQVVATVDGVRGRVVAESTDDWIVDVRTDDAVRERQFDIREVGFRTGPPALRPFADVPWKVSASGRLPVVYINTDFEGMTDLLAAEGRSPAGLVNELLVSQMAADVWTAVFHAAVGDLEIEEDGSPMFPHDWRGEVLREMLPDVLPNLPLEDALRAVHRRRTGATGWTELQPNIHAAAARRADVPKALATTLLGLDRFNRKDAEA